MDLIIILGVFFICKEWQKYEYIPSGLKAVFTEQWTKNCKRRVEYLCILTSKKGLIYQDWFIVIGLGYKKMKIKAEIEGDLLRWKAAVNKLEWQA